MAGKDNAFRRMLGDKELFLRFLRRFLRRDVPLAVDAAIESGDFSLDDIVLENISFIPPDLREKRSDIVYRIRSVGLEAYVYILIEHQSRVDYLMPYRLLSYMIQLWSRCISERSVKKTALSLSGRGKNPSCEASWGIPEHPCKKRGFGNSCLGRGVF